MKKRLRRETHDYRKCNRGVTGPNLIRPPKKPAFVRACRHIVGCLVLLLTGLARRGDFIRMDLHLLLEREGFHVDYHHLGLDVGPVPAWRRESGMASDRIASINQHPTSGTK